MQGFERKEKEINFKIKELHVMETQLGEILGFLKDTSHEAKDFLMDHLGTKEGQIILAKRLYYTWQQELKRANIIEYDIYSYSWKVQNVDKLIEATEKKLSNYRSRRCMYFNFKNDSWNSSSEYKKVIDIYKQIKTNNIQIRTKVYKIC